MSQVIKFLEALGASGIELSDKEFIAATAALNVEHSHREALQDKNRLGLNSLLGGRESMMFSIFADEEENVQTVCPVMQAA